MKTHLKSQNRESVVYQSPSDNVAFRQILLAKSADDSLTDYTREMALLVQRTEKLFRSHTEKWIKSKRVLNTDVLASEIKEILKAVKELTYAAPETPPSAMDEPVRASTDDTLGALLTGVLDNLIGRLSKRETAKSAAAYAGSLASQAREHHQSGIWRTMSSPPLKYLSDLSERLGDVSCILHEIAHDSRPNAIQQIVKAARKARLGTAVRAAARRCCYLADRRFKTRLRRLEHVLIERGWNARCLSRALDKSNSAYWPACEVAILVEITDFETQWARWIDETLSLGKQHLENDRLFSSVPVMNDQVLAPLALRASSPMPVHDPDFARNWSACLDKPIFSSALVETFDEAVDACMQISAIFVCCDLQDLHPQEGEILSKDMDTFKRNREIVANAVDRTETEHLALALDYLDSNWNRIIDEFDSVKVGRVVEDPLCMTQHLALAGEENEHVAEFGTIRLLLLQAECKGAVII